MVVLDTDHITVWQLSLVDEAGHRLIDRLRRISGTDRATTIISFEEQARGRLEPVKKAREEIDKLLEAYRNLNKLLDFYGPIRVLDFDEAAAAHYQRLRLLRSRIGTMDLRHCFGP